MQRIVLRSKIASAWSADDCMVTQWWRDLAKPAYACHRYLLPDDVPGDILRTGLKGRFRGTHRDFIIK